MLRSLLLSLVLLLPMAANAQTVVSLDIGGREVKVEVPKDYVRRSEAAPELEEAVQKMLPATNLLIDTLVAADDIPRQKIGLTTKSTTYQIQVMRSLQRVDISADDWKIGRPIMLKEMGVMDLSGVDEVQKNIDASLEGKTDGAVKVQIGDIGKLLPYGNDADTIRFTMIVPVTIEVNGAKIERRAMVGSLIAVVSKRLVMLYAQRMIEDDEAAALQGVRTDLDAFYARVKALNP